MKMGIIVALISIILFILILIKNQKKVKQLTTQIEQQKQTIYWQQDQAYLQKEQQLKEEFAQKLKDYQQKLDLLSDLLQERTDRYEELETEEKQKLASALIGYQNQLLHEASRRQNSIETAIEENHKLRLLEKQSELDEIQAQIFYAKDILDDFKSKQETINEAIHREKQIQEQQDFYRIQISENDQHDIQVLHSISGELINQAAICKLVWDVYISRPVIELIKRVTNGHEGGIYKITYIPTGEAYIGRTTNFKERWKNHCLTITGCKGGAARSSFHDFAAKRGLWNFTFEILEDVDKEHQAEREKFWIDFYGTKEFGLNSVRGG